MIQLSIIFKNSSVTLPLNFKAYKNADEMRKKISFELSGFVEVEDDYGTMAGLLQGDIAGVILIDLNKEIDRQIEFQMMQQAASKKQHAGGGKILQPVPMPSMN